MILLGPLTKLEKEKLEGQKQEIMLGFRRRVVPVFKRRFGGIEGIVTAPDRRKFLRNAEIFSFNWREEVRSRAEQYRGISFVSEIMREVARGIGIPQSMLEEMASLRMAPVELSYVAMCRCPICTVQIQLAAEGRREMHPVIQESGPARRIARRDQPIGGFGSIEDRDPGFMRIYRRNNIDATFRQAENNREMQYDERTWEI